MWAPQPQVHQRLPLWDPPRTPVCRQLRRRPPWTCPARTLAGRQTLNRTAKPPYQSCAGTLPGLAGPWAAAASAGAAAAETARRARRAVQLGLGLWF